LSSTVIKVNKPIQDVQFSGFKEIYEYTVENKEPEHIEKIPEVPEPEIKQFTEDELTQQLNKAYQKGLNDGIKQTHDEFQADVKHHVDLLDKVAKQILNSKYDLIRTNDEIILKMALNIARKVIKTELKINPDIISNVLKSVLEKLATIEKEIFVRLNPEDKEILNQNLSEVGSHLQEIKIEGDERITKGGCVVETNYSTIDATIETQLEEIERALFKELEND
jgi:flagellar assembly protein FliH